MLHVTMSKKKESFKRKRTRKARENFYVGRDLKKKPRNGQEYSRKKKSDLET